MEELDEKRLGEEGEGEILVMFHFSSGCKWCDRMKKPFEVYAEKHPELKCGTYSFGPFNKGDKPALAEQLKIKSLPSFIHFKSNEGKFIARDEILYEAFIGKEQLLVDPSEESQCDSCQ